MALEYYAVSHERTVLLLFFLVVFGLMSLWEWKASRRKQKIPKAVRWPNNLALTLINTLILRVLFPGASLGAAYWAFHHQFGLFYWVEVPLSFAVVLTIINLDWVLYYQHRAFHAVPWFWKFHRVHHTDLEVDVTTGLRFHPLEMGVSLTIKSAVIVLLGAPVFGVLLFEVIFNTVSLFNHSNVRLPGALDKLLRWFIVTPELHRVHHSAISRETNSDFGFVFSWWDKVFGTYRPEPAEGHEKMRIGLDIFNEPKDLKVDQLLLQPFRD